MSVPYPRLLDSGFEGMSLEEMTSPVALEAAFPGVSVDPAQLELRGPSGVRLATIYRRDLKAYKVAIENPGLTTVHGLAVGSRLEDVLKLHVRHRCEKISSVINSMPTVVRVIRCWVGTKPARFRYVASLPDAPEMMFEHTDALWLDDSGRAHGGGPTIDPVDYIPDRGKALDNWIARSGLRIDQILWRNDLDDER